MAIIGICIFLLNSFGELLFRKATGLEYSEAVLKVFWENGPLSIAIAFISWRCYRLGAGEWSGLTEFLACGAALCAAGLATQWTTHVPVFSDAWHRGAGYAWLGRWDFISRIAATVVYTLRGYLDLYGLPRFFLIAFTAATAPWIVMRMYGKAMAKADAAGGAD
ncbi:MAG TPA: hypothetical protein VJ385_07980 [Fibrobacteria bacterium]|nr:hypothetical protein [Fibrobacteria bacterium]